VLSAQSSRPRASLLLIAGVALVCVSIFSASPAQAVATCSDGQKHEKLTCDDKLKVSKCFDARVTCRNWDVNDCCSAVPIHKCLNPFAGRAFGFDCSSPIDAREECCADPVTHRRAFQALADLQASIESGVSSTLAVTGLNSTFVEAELALAHAADVLSSEASSSYAYTAAAAKKAADAVAALAKTSVPEEQLAKLKEQASALQEEVAAMAAPSPAP